MNMYDYIHLVGTRVVRVRIPISRKWVLETGFPAFTYEACVA